MTPEILLNKFNSVTLDEINEVNLLDRIDKKYTFEHNLLPDILSKILPYYQILTINGKRISRYETIYFDTPDYQMYIHHHNKKLNRNKVRCRSYLDSGLHFFEVKFKSNKGRTVKKRVVLPTNDPFSSLQAAALLKKKTPYLLSDLQEAIRVNYNRITFASKDMKERLTLDIGLTYNLNGTIKSFPGMIIAEVKQDKSGISPFTDIMLSKRIKNISISKYCLGMASLVPGIKINNFKLKLHYVNKICNASA